MNGMVIKGISSMATRQVLTDLVAGFQKQSGMQVAIESVGGVDAAKRVQSGEAFDVVILASDAIDKLLSSGHLATGSKTDLFRSDVAVAIRDGSPVPDISTEATLRKAVCNAKTISYSTGPSGVALARLFERWGLAEQLKSRIVQPAPGIPVGTLVSRGEVELGFQQYSELMSVEGLKVLGVLPQEIGIVTIFSAGIHAHSKLATEVRNFLQYISSPDTTETKRRCGMDQA